MAFDNKMGTWIVTETLRLLQKRSFDGCVIGVSTVQEEIGLRGATTSFFPDKTFTKMDHASWRKVLSINLDGVFNCAADGVLALSEIAGLLGKLQVGPYADARNDDIR